MPIDPYKGLILLQRFIGRSGNVVTHDPRITEMVESAAEARHQQVVSQIEIQAQSLQEALRIRENEELMRAREVMSNEAMQMRELVTREAENEICRQQRNANATVEDYKRVMDNNLRQSISSKDRHTDYKSNSISTAARTHSPNHSQCSWFKDGYSPSISSYVEPCYCEGSNHWKSNFGE